MGKMEEIGVYAANMRRHILDMGRHAGNHAAHMGGALSLVEILSTLYFGVMNTIEVGMDSPERDRLILSKGHGALGYYAALVEAGFADESLKNTFEDDYSDFLGHPVQNRKIGIEFTNGSLGMGLSVAEGVAIGCRKSGLRNHVYVVLGDGECDEGSCWEAFMSAPHFRLDNLTAIVDCNGFQLSGKNDDVMCLGNLTEKLNAFGWNAVECDGHDIGQLYGLLKQGHGNGKPMALVAKTVKGKGFSFSENNNAWHHAVVTEKYYKQGLEELCGEAACDGI